MHINWNRPLTAKDNNDSCYPAVLNLIKDNRNGTMTKHVAVMISEINIQHFLFKEDGSGINNDLIIINRQYFL